MKKTRIYLSGSYYLVENVSGARFEIYSLSGRNAKMVASNDDLYKAVAEFDNSRDCQDDIHDAFASSKFYNEVLFDEDGFLNQESYDKAFEKFMDSLDGDDYFDIVRDGTYQAYVDWNEINEEIEEDEDDE